jgi:hypothetical protein
VRAQAAVRGPEAALHTRPPLAPTIFSHRTAPVRPGWIRLGWELLLRYLLAAVLLLGLALILDWLGVSRTTLPCADRRV